MAIPTTVHQSSSRKHNTKNRDTSNKTPTAPPATTTKNNHKEKTNNQHKKTITNPNDQKSGSNETPAAPATTTTTTATTSIGRHRTTGRCPVSAAIKGSDDAGVFYNSHDELRKVQNSRREEFYKANATYWSTGGYGGLTDEEAMIGDTGGIQDGEEGLFFLDKLLALAEASSALTSAINNANNNKKNPKKNLDATKNQQQQQQTKKSNPTEWFMVNDFLRVTSSSLAPHSKYRLDHAVDLGAGVGRVTKHILLKRYTTVRLVEADGGWSKRSKVYLGRKRAARCTFDNSRLDELTHENVLNWNASSGATENSSSGGGGGADLIWIQWTLQYLTDDDVVDCLHVIAGGLRHGTGILVVKENRPYGMAREDRFQMEVPNGSNDNHRYDITRSDHHHRYLFQLAGLRVVVVERGVETNTYALQIDSTN
jgi:AdoMet dependent proline di-methyltransferase